MADTKYYYDYNYPLPLVASLLKILGSRDQTNSPLTDTASREWFSQPRTGTSTETECLTVTFRLPLSVSEITVDILKMPCRVEIWYQDRSNNWRPVLDPQRSPLEVRVDRSDTKSWYKWSNKCYPIVAKKVQLRLTRVNDGVLTDTPYPVGLRNTLIKRNIHDRRQGGSFEDDVDVMGNLVSRYIRDWDARQATDNNYTTFWKSAPQPDPDAVVSLFLDVRSETGAPQIIDKVYLDPVYANQHLNLYYSSDETISTRIPSPITLPPPSTPNAVVNASWRNGVGLTGGGDCIYSWPLQVGPQSRQDGWVGVEWLPDFGTLNTPNLAQNPMLFDAGQPTGNGYKPALYYDAAARKFALQMSNGSTTLVWRSSAIGQEWSAGDSIKVVAGWRYGDTPSVHLKVVDVRSRVIATLDQSASNLPDLVAFSGVASVSDFRGVLTNLVVKLEDHRISSAAFLANPAIYCDPDPVLPDSGGRYPSTSLDNAIYVAPFLSREHGSGGSDPSHFEDKEWTPIWRNYQAIKGMLHLPQPISMKYLKLEFTNLTEQPYPVYESGVESTYKVYPVSVTQQSSLGTKTYSGEGGFLGMGTFISVNGVRSVNWLDPNSVMQAISGVLGTQIPPVLINTGVPYLTDSLPNKGAVEIESSRRIEAASSYVYAREALQPYVLAEDKYNTLIKAEGLQAIQPYVDIPWKDLERANPGAVTKIKSMGTLPVRGSDWWIYPGQQLKVPAAVMAKLTETETVTERKFTLERRVRFNTTSVHRYEWRTVKRDAAVAYFAGVREVQPYTSTFIRGEDVAVYNFPSYTPNHWVFTNIQQHPTGTVTAAYPAIYGVISKDMISQSDFSKVTVNFQDAGLIRSNPMWVDISQDTDTIDDTQLSPYFGIIPDDAPRGNWSDTLANWNDQYADWGSSYALVGISVDPNRRYDGRRVVKFTRQSGIGQAGLKLQQWLNFVPGGLFRLGAVVYRPTSSDNAIIMRLRRVSDNSMVLESRVDQELPTGRWQQINTDFIEIPETLSNSSFDNNLVGWIPSGGTWTAVSDKGYTGTKSARLATNGTKSTLTTQLMDIMNGTTVSGSAWVTWSGLTAGQTVRLNAVFYDIDDQVVLTVPLENQVTTTASTTSWHPISGTCTVPFGQGITQVGFQVEVPASAGTGGSVWVDDFSVDVTGAPRQQYILELTVEGEDQEELYVSDLFTEITPIRYFAQFGVATGSNPVTWDSPIEVTDLRHTRSESIVTRSTPANALRIQAVLANPRAYAFGCRIVPHYLR